LGTLPKILMFEKRARSCSVGCFGRASEQRTAKSDQDKKT
jgi:hypothetical protein